MKLTTTISPQKIAIIGSPGAGKSTYALYLANQTGLPVIHLDKEYFLPSWKKRFTKEQWSQYLEKITNAPQWIIDGNYSSTLEIRVAKADQVIWINIPIWKALYRIIKRNLRNNNPARSTGCEEQVNSSLLKSILLYPWKSIPKIKALMKKYGEEKFVTLRG